MALAGTAGSATQGVPPTSETSPPGRARASAVTVPPAVPVASSTSRCSGRRAPSSRGSITRAIPQPAARARRAATGSTAVTAMPAARRSCAREGADQPEADDRRPVAGAGAGDAGVVQGHGQQPREDRLLRRQPVRDRDAGAPGGVDAHERGVAAHRVDERPRRDPRRGAGGDDLADVRVADRVGERRPRAARHRQPLEERPLGAAAQQGDAGADDDLRRPQVVGRQVEGASSARRGPVIRICWPRIATSTSARATPAVRRPDPALARDRTPHRGVLVLVRPRLALREAGGPEGVRSTVVARPSVIHSARHFPMAGLVLNDVPLSPAMQKSPSYCGSRSMIGRASGLIIRMPAQLPRIVLCRIAGTRRSSAARHWAMYSARTVSGYWSGSGLRFTALGADEGAVAVDQAHPAPIDRVDVGQVPRGAVGRPAEDDHLRLGRHQAKIDAERREEPVGPGPGGDHDHGRADDPGADRLHAGHPPPR